MNAPHPAQPAPPLPARAPTLFHHPASITEPVKWDLLFARRQPVEVEIGSGDGSFLLQYAALHPDRNFLAIERLLGRIRKLDRKGPRLGLQNLRLLRFEAGYAVEYLLPPSSVQALHVYFPDPWPKRRHHRRRLVNGRFMELAGRVLVPGGVLYLRTDDASYHAQMEQVGRANKAFEEVPTPEELSRVSTDFEKDFLAQGVSTRRAAFQRVK